MNIDIYSILVLFSSKAFLYHDLLNVKELFMAHEANTNLLQWLAKEIPEEIIEPSLPIVDPHHHLWDLRTYDDEILRAFQHKVYLCEEITDEIRFSGHNVVQTVFAQCDAFYRASGEEALKCVGETEFVNGISAMSRSGRYGYPEVCAGIFSYADLRAGKDVERVLSAHLAASNNFRGIRSAFPQDLNNTFLDGYAVLGKLGLSFDNYHPDYERLLALAKLGQKFPEVTIIVNHLGGKIDPNNAPKGIARWRECINEISKCPNVVMKLGGAQQRVGSWEPPFHNNLRRSPIGSGELCDLLYEYYIYAIEAFGPDRCMFESNFPVDKECVSYRTLWNTFKLIAKKAGLSATEKTAIFSGTAQRVYRLSQT